MKSNSSTYVYGAIAMAGLVALLLIGAGTAVMMKVRLDGPIDPDNFRTVNEAFFRSLADREIEVISFTADEPIEVKAGEMRISIVPLVLDEEDRANQRNRVAHSHDALTVYACHTFLHEDEDLGLRLIELLHEHVPDLRYHYASLDKRSLFGGIASEYIEISELLHAARRASDGDDSRRRLLEEPASQFDFRVREYAPESFTEREGELDRSRLTAPPPPLP